MLLICDKIYGLISINFSILVIENIDYKIRKVHAVIVYHP